MKTKLLKSWLMLVMLLVGVGTSWADNVVKATFNSDDVVNNSAYASTYGGDDWSINMAGNNKSIGFNNKNCVAINDALGTGATASNYGIVVKSKKPLSNVNRIEFSYNGGSGQGGKIYLAYSTDNTNWSAISLNEGEDLTSQGATVATTLENALVFEFSEIASAYYAFILDSGDTKTAAYRFDAVVVNFIQVIQGEDPQPTALSVPTNLSSSNVTTTGATLSWDAVSNASSYTVKIGETEYTDVNSNSYSATGLTAGTQYTWTVKAVGDGTNYTTSAYAANATFTTEAEQGTDPEEPSGNALTIDFESATSVYTDWIFTNIVTQQTNSNVSAHSGDYYGGTNAKTTGSVQTKEKVNPGTITFYISKESTNTTSSSWKVQTSTNGTSWTDVKTVSASSVTRGEWTEVTQSLTAYKNVYVRIYYDGTTARRCIDDVTLTLNSNDAPVAITCHTPTFSIEAGQYTSEQTVSLSCETEGASIYYTIDGTTPTSSSTLYSSAISITETTTIKAIAIKDGYENSEVVEATYTIVLCEGQGTKDNPYTLSDVKKLNNPKIKAWVVGYIRGCYSSTEELATDAVETNIAMSETLESKIYYPVGLKSGYARTDLNLKSHPENLGYCVKVYGSLEAYFSTNGVKDVTDYEWVGDIPAPQPTYTVKTLTLTAKGEMPAATDMGEGGYPGYFATFSSDKDTFIPMFDESYEYSAYVYTVFTDGVDLLLEHADNAFVEEDEETGLLGYYVPANNGILLFVTPEEEVNSITIPYYEIENVEVAPLSEDNMLRPATATKETDGSYKFYKLAYSDSSMKPSSLGFYWGAANGAAFTSREGSAYLAVPTEISQNAAGFRFIEEDDNVATGISDVNVNTTANAIYNLNGQRVNASAKGIVIMNGKKMLNK